VRVEVIHRIKFLRYYLKAYTRQGGFTPAPAPPSGVGETLSEVHAWLESLDYVREQAGRCVGEGLACRAECFMPFAIWMRAGLTKRRTLNMLAVVSPTTCPHGYQGEQQRSCTRCSLVIIEIATVSAHKHLANNMDLLFTFLRQCQDFRASPKRPSARQRRPRTRASGR
jgi:hypothetical protein